MPLEELCSEPVQGRWTVAAERLGDRSVVISRQRRFDGDLLLDRVRELARSLRIALALENLGQQSNDGRSQSYAGNPHRFEATGLPGSRVCVTRAESRGWPCRRKAAGRPSIDPVVNR